MLTNVWPFECDCLCVYAEWMSLMVNIECKNRLTSLSRCFAHSLNDRQRGVNAKTWNLLPNLLPHVF